MQRLLKNIQAMGLRAGLIGLTVVGFFLAGFTPTFLLGTPSVGVMLAVGAIIPFGSYAGNLPRAIGRGIVLGAAAGVGLTWALGIARQGEVPGSYMAIYIGSTVLISTAVAAIFFRLAQRRTKLIDAQWK